MAAIAYCTRCASHLIDVVGWSKDGQTATLCCHNCGHQRDIQGFTVARLGPTIGYEQAEAIAGVAMSDVAINQHDPDVTRRFAQRAMDLVRGAQRRA